MRAATALTAVVVLASLALAGCTGSLASKVDPSSAGSAEATASDGSTLNLTVEVADVDARWRPDREVRPAFPAESPTEIEVTVTLNASVRNGTRPEGGELVGGIVNITSAVPWGPSMWDRTEKQIKSYANGTGRDGNTTAQVTVTYDAHLTPPVSEPYCEYMSFWAWGIVDWTSEDGPQDADFAEVWVCTQTYP